MLQFQARPYQLPIIRALNSGKKRAVWVCHRRAGKDITIFNWVIYKLCQEPQICFYVLPTYAQAKKVIWDSITIEGIRFLDFIPKEIIESKNGQEMKIRLINGSVLQLIGSDNIDSLVGTNPRIIVFSEYAIQSNQAWDYLSPILKVNGGTAIFISTPRGKNHFYDLYNHARNDPEWFCEKLTILDTHVVKDSDLDQDRKEGMSEEHIQQEYYCSFDRGVEGSYYGKIIEQAYKEKRICNVPYDPSAPVNTAWDLGFRDSTSIVFWQDVGGELRIIDFFEDSSQKLESYVKEIKSRPYNYGMHYLPHDAGNNKLDTGKNIAQLIYEIGLTPTTILKRENSIQLGIDSARSILSIAYIDQTKCKHLIKCLENYTKKYNDKLQVYSDEPLHNWASHAADAFRYMACARNDYGRGVGTMTPDKLKEVKAAAGYGPKYVPQQRIQQPFIGRTL